MKKYLTFDRKLVEDRFNLPHVDKTKDYNEKLK